MTPDAALAKTLPLSLYPLRTAFVLRTLLCPQAAEDCLLFPTGFAANLSVMTSLTATLAAPAPQPPTASTPPPQPPAPAAGGSAVARAYGSKGGGSGAAGGGDVAIFSDELNHASIIDGARLASRGSAKLFIYRHNDLDHLEVRGCVRYALCPHTICCGLTLKALRPQCPLQEQELVLYWPGRFRESALMLEAPLVERWLVRTPLLLSAPRAPYRPLTPLPPLPAPYLYPLPCPTPSRSCCAPRLPTCGGWWSPTRCSPWTGTSRTSG